jgi:riboflavin biosynthesis pyrimidine reductase
MVEGGPTTARLFLDDNLIDRAILVRAPIQFKTPIPAGFNEEKLKEAGLVLIGNEIMGGDTVEYWVREGMEWPTKDLTSWP